MNACKRTGIGDDFHKEEMNVRVKRMRGSKKGRMRTRRGAEGSQENKKCHSQQPTTSEEDAVYSYIALSTLHQYIVL